MYRRYYRDSLFVNLYYLLGYATECILGALFVLGYIAHKKGLGQKKEAPVKEPVPLVKEKEEVPSPNIFTQFSDALKYGYPLIPEAKAFIKTSVEGLDDKDAERTRMELFIELSNFDADQQKMKLGVDIQDTRR